MDRRAFLKAVGASASVVAVTRSRRGGIVASAWPAGTVVSRAEGGRLRPYDSESGDAVVGVWDGKCVLTSGSITMRVRTS